MVCKTTIDERHAGNEGQQRGTVNRFFRAISFPTTDEIVKGTARYLVALARWLEHAVRWDYYKLGKVCETSRIRTTRL